MHEAGSSAQTGGDACHVGPGHRIARKPRNGGSASPPIIAAGYNRGRPCRSATRQQVVALELSLPPAISASPVNEKGPPFLTSPWGWLQNRLGNERAEPR